MKFSTSRWLTIALFSTAAILITWYFYLDAKDKMIPFLATIIRPLGAGLLLFPCFILLANIMATTGKEERITKQHFRSAFIILSCLIAFKVITSLF
ncbi:hypothetical protein [Sporosarcina jiandibaonis]|uniref:hypothetical protein n=1 Tax=Sporosarcina jiandibaonis TaxID=2715535 RepID=UPI001551C0CD|nr:hypothetical protein [Sporosarcina jiandibaonis]